MCLTARQPVARTGTAAPILLKSLVELVPFTFMKILALAPLGSKTDEPFL